MKWCWLLGHRFDVKQVGEMCVKSCKCGETYILIEVSDRITGNSKESYWRKVQQKKDAR